MSRKHAELLWNWRFESSCVLREPKNSRFCSRLIHVSCTSLLARKLLQIDQLSNLKSTAVQVQLID